GDQQVLAASLHSLNTDVRPQLDLPERAAVADGAECEAVELPAGDRSRERAGGAQDRVSLGHAPSISAVGFPPVGDAPRCGRREATDGQPRAESPLYPSANPASCSRDASGDSAAGT